MQNDAAPAPVLRSHRFKRLGVAILLLLILVVGNWMWFGFRQLTAQEKALVGRWRITVTSQLNLFPPYTEIWEIKPDRTLHILRDDPKSPGKLIVHFDCNWKVRSNNFDLDFYPPRNLRAYVRQLQDIAQRFQFPSSHQTEYEIRSVASHQIIIRTLQTKKPVSYEVYDMVRQAE